MAIVFSRLVWRIARSSWLSLLWPGGSVFVPILLAGLSLWAVYEVPKQLTIPNWIILVSLFGLGLSALRIIYRAASDVIPAITYYKWFQDGLRFAPNALLNHNLLSIVGDVHSRPDQWHRLGFRSSLMYWVEMCARCFESMPRVIQTFDSGTDAALRKQASEIAAGFRKLKASLLAPAPDGRDVFLKRILSTMNAAVFGDLSSLERVELPEIANQKKAPLGRRILAQINTLVKALLPLALALVATRVGIGESGEPLVTGTIANYIVGGTVAYAVLTILMVVDPQLAAWITVAKDIMSMASTSKEGSNKESAGQGPSLPG